MQEATTEILQGVLGDEFKISVEKMDKILRALDLECKKLQDTIDFRKKELDGLDKRKSSLQDEIIMAFKDKEDSFKQAQDNFEISKGNSTSALEAREKNLEAKELSHEINVKSHQDSVTKFNMEKSQFATKKQAIVETLQESLALHTGIITDAIDAMKEGPEPAPEVKPETPKEEPKPEPAQTVD